MCARYRKIWRFFFVESEDAVSSVFTGTNVLGVHQASKVQQRSAVSHWQVTWHYPRARSNCITEKIAQP